VSKSPLGIHSIFGPSGFFGVGFHWVWLLKIQAVRIISSENLVKKIDFIKPACPSGIKRRAYY
jgi:hypothetical protein